MLRASAPLAWEPIGCHSYNRGPHPLEPFSHLNEQRDDSRPEASEHGDGRHEGSDLERGDSPSFRKTFVR